MKQIHIFNVISGIIIIVSMILLIVVGSNNLPYILIALFIISYFMQVKNFGRIVWIMITGLILILSLGTLLPHLFAP
ncbi:hypothetical protein NQ129_25720 [Priestia aryabhattai]|uniref:hypothetical protein n=1 Tax=Priestia aryabhattai TaxID=412384 RepID=UPI00211CD260|nr:hypothetical protein [Priestia aryabhattai]MCQ9285169.1 hypothetical protein [Priestia aryabhattai]